jgi:hypothetical protein
MSSLFKILACSFKKNRFFSIFSFVLNFFRSSTKCHVFFSKNNLPFGFAERAAAVFCSAKNRVAVIFCA